MKKNIKSTVDRLLGEADTAGMEAKDKPADMMTDEVFFKEISDKFGITPDQVKEQLSKGIEVEKEHFKVYDTVKSLVKDGTLLMTADDFFKMIAMDHIREMWDYYVKLATIETPSAV